jgi:DNA topoisomerase IA
MRLVIVESPAKTQKIAGFLGPGYRVLASFGHIRALEESLDALDLDGDFTPRYTFLKEKARAIAAIRAAAADATEVILASDDDREGEAIAYSVAALLRLPPTTTKRAVFHEITKTAVTTAIANPRVIDMNRVYAQQSRSMLDMMIGFTISPLLWKYVGRGLSAGRCQTPALRFVCEREAEIEGHQTASTWAVTGTWSAAATNTFLAFPASLIDELEDSDSAMATLEILRDERSATITKATTSPWTANAPPPLITSTLQQEASALYKCNPKATMRAAQKLYEAGHITYMRTDSAVLSEEAAAAARQLVEERFGSDYVATATATTATKPAPAQAQAQAKKTTKKAAPAAEAQPGQPGQPGQPAPQEAHEAIRPTHFELEELAQDEEWSAQERKIYKLIWQRAVQSVMAAAQGEQRQLQFLSNAEELVEFPWQAKWRRTTFPGWRALAVAAAKLDEETDEEDSAATAWKLATSLKVGSKLQWQRLEAQPKETRALPRYTEATLVRELERKGIGRPSTFASLIAAIQDKGYVEIKDIAGVKRAFTTYTLQPEQWPPQENAVEKTVGAEKGKLVPTALGVSALAFALQHFADLFDYSFTAAMEKQLDDIAAGKEPWKKVLRQTWDSYSARYQTLKDGQGVSQGQGPKASGAPSDRIRDFGGGFKAVLSKKGPLLFQEAPEGSPEGIKPTFYGWPGRKGFHDITEADARKFIKEWEQEHAASAPVILEAPAEAEEEEDDANGSNHEEAASAGSADSHNTPKSQPITANQIVKKKGKFGYYAECNGVRVACAETDTYRDIAAKLAAKAKAAQPVRVGPYEFRTGQYGPYMFKTDLKTKKFVSVPKDLDTSSLTVKSAEAIYKAGLEAAAKKGKHT